MQHDNDNANASQPEVETVKVRHIYIFPAYAEEVSEECGLNAAELLETLQEAVDDCDRAASNADDAKSAADQARDDADTAEECARDASEKLAKLETAIQAIADDEQRRGKWMQDAQSEAYRHGFNAGWMSAMNHARKATMAMPEVVK